MKKQMIQSDRAWGLLIPLGVVAGSLHAASPLPAKPNVTDPNFPDSPVNDAKRRNFCALVTELDEEIARIMAKLNAKGLDEKTLVIYMSDNGGWIGLGGNNGPLRGGKWGIHEGGQRVPFIWRWPGVLPAGKEFRQENGDKRMNIYFPVLPSPIPILLSKIPAIKFLIV